MGTNSKNGWRAIIFLIICCLFSSLFAANDIEGSLKVNGNLTNTGYHYLGLSNADDSFRLFANSGVLGVEKRVLSNWNPYKVTPDYQYNLTVTGPNWITIRAVGIVRPTANGSYWIDISIVGTTITSTTGTMTIHIDGITFKNAANFIQYVGCSSITASGRGTATPNTNTIVCISGNSNRYGFTATLELESKPTFANLTP